jgi:membrane-associated phospholipid phosphatase
MRKLVLLIVAISLSLPLLCQNVDIDLLKKINLNRNTNLDGTFQFITDSAAIIAYGLPAIILLSSFIFKNSLHKRKGIVIGASILLSSIVASILKHTVNRSRPFEVYNFIQNVGEGGSPSIPSGHTTDAFAIATAICLAYPKWYIILPAFLWAFAVGYSRMDLGVHYPSDVLAGALIGSGVSLLCYKIDDRLKKAQK